MKFYTYWHKENIQLNIEGRPRTASFYGGSDISVEDAKKEALKKRDSVQSKIDGRKDAFEDYEAAIREEVLERLDQKNIVSRNRYGAMILNSENLFFIDIDDARCGFFKWLFSWRKLSKKERILKMIAETASLEKFKGMSFRIYETHNGFRLMVIGREIRAGSKESNQIMRDFNSDWLYSILCSKQGCYRARLTPKSSRMRFKSMKIVFPRNKEQEINLKRWLEEYNDRSRNYSVCKFITQLGNAPVDRIIEYHDRICKAHENHTLA